MSATCFAEQREYEPLPLRLPLRFARGGRSDLIECTTESISGAELCFVSPELLQPGDRVDVDVLLLANKLSRSASKIHLKCLVDVERVDQTRLTTGFRIGCRIRNYEISFGSTDFRPGQVS
jgi:hypothetical protein